MQELPKLLDHPPKSDLPFYLDKIVRHNLEIWKRGVLEQDMDMIGVVDGLEGAGKSVLAQQLAYFLDVNNSLSLSRIVFTPEGFKASCLSAEKGQAIVYDEARGGLNRRRSMSGINNAITDMLAEIRQKNLFIILVMPTFYEMDKNAAIWRTRFLCHVTMKVDRKSNGFLRGYYSFYSERGKKLLYCNRRHSQFYAYPKQHAAVSDARFKKWYAVDEDDYKKSKYNALRAHDKKTEDTVIDLSKISLKPIKEKKEEFDIGLLYG